MSHVVVVSAGSRPGSATERLATEIEDTLSTQDHSPLLTRVPLADVGPEIAAGLVSCRMHEALAPVCDDLAAADALVVVTPVHHASYSALFKAFFDQVPRGLLTGVPTLMAASGGSTRDTLVLDTALRPYLSALRALVVPTGVVVTPDDRDAHDRLLPDVAHRMQRACGELTRLLAPSAESRRAIRAAG